MPRGPKDEKRPADAIMIARIATAEIEDMTTEDGKNAAAVALGRMGGKARAAGMTAKKRWRSPRRQRLKDGSAASFVARREWSPKYSEYPRQA